MADFSYRAVDSEGSKKRGILSADSAVMVRQQLRNQGLTPITIKRSLTQKTERATVWWRQRVRAAELLLFSRQLATLVSSGMPLERSLYLISEQANKPRTRRLINQVRNYIVEGSSFAAALRRAPRVFPTDFIATVAAAEESGHMSQVLERLADNVEHQVRTRQTLGAALIYPLMMTHVAILIVILLMIYVVPQVTEVFAQHQQTLPPLTAFLIASSDFIRIYGWLLGFVLIVASGSFLLLLRRYGFRARVHQWLLCAPLLRHWLRASLLSSWTRSLGMLIGSGVPSLQALHIAGEGVSNDFLRQALVRVTHRVREGSSLHRALRDESALFPGFLVHMISSGEASGNLDGMLLKCASYYERTLKSAIEVALKIFEPMLILVMGGMVLAIVLAILMPIFQINQLVF